MTTLVWIMLVEHCMCVRANLTRTLHCITGASSYNVSDQWSIANVAMLDYNLLNEIKLNIVSGLISLRRLYVVIYNGTSKV